jgi:hypothetical protein
MPKKTTTVVLPSTTPTAPKKGSQDEAVVNNPSHDILEKVVGVQPAMRRKKATVAAAFALILFSFVYFFLLALYCITFLFAVALNKALARVASLEAELKTTSQALKDANISKNSAENAEK